MKHLLLLGGGHAHVQVVRAFGTSPPADTRVTLMSSARLTPYSGMLPGFIAGHYSRSESHIDLARLCAASRIRFIEQHACALYLAERCVASADGARHPYDLLAIDTGSTPPLAGVPGADQHAIPIKPVDRFIAALESLGAEPIRSRGRSVAVVGAGAAGFEVILALEHRLRKQPDHPGALTLRLVTEAAHVLEEFPPRVRTLAERILRRQGVAVHTCARAARIDARGIVLDDGARIDANPVIFVTGAAPAAMYAAAGLETDARGFIVVDAALRSLSHPEVFASGDAATVRAHPRPKAGVIAVRQGPPLIRNLRRALAGKAPLPFVPQRQFLVLLSTGRKHAIASRNGWTLHGAWVWRWKDWIDRRFVARFTVPGGEHPETPNPRAD